MARIRSFKADLWTDPEFVACSMAARLLWLGTWNYADDYGVLKDDPAKLKLQVMPADDIDPYELVDELVDRKLLLRKVTPDKTNVLVIRTFMVHQKIDKRSPGRWGHPDEFTDAPRSLSVVPRREPAVTRGNEPVPTDPPDSPPDPTIGKEGIGGSFLVNPDGSTEPEEPFGGAFAECWSLYPRKQGRKEALRAYQARRRRGVPHQVLLNATRNYAQSVHGKERQYVMHGKRFYGPNDPWADFIEAPSTEPVDRSSEVVER